MPWEPGRANLGFSTGTPWLSMGGRDDSHAAAAQWADPLAVVHRYRDLVAWRHSVPSPQVPVEWIEHEEPAVIGYRRASMVVVANVGATEVVVPFEAIPCSVAHRVGDVRIDGAVVRLGAECAAVLEFPT